MSSSAENLSKVIAAGLFVVGLILLSIYRSTWPWSTIGGLVALAGLLILLMRDHIKDYGGDHDKEARADAGGRPMARVVHPFVYSIGIPLVVLSAICQVVGNPLADFLIRDRSIPDGVVYTPKNGKRSLDLVKLDTALRVLAIGHQRLDSAIAAGPTLDLLLVNCGAITPCLCPTGYARIRDTGKWDLNAGATGDRITFCLRTRTPVGSSKSPQ